MSFLHDTKSLYALGVLLGQLKHAFYQNQEKSIAQNTQQMVRGALLKEDLNAERKCEAWYSKGCDLNMNLAKRINLLSVLHGSRYVKYCFRL